MKKRVIFCLILATLILSSCNLPEKVSEEMVRTSVALTMQAKVNAIASLTPPTPTATETLIPSETPTPTISPTPTIKPTATWTMHEAGSAQVLILYYYDIANGREDDAYYQWESDLYIPSIEFEQQVRMLYELGYTSITLSDMVNVLRVGGELPERPVMFTFDSTELGQWKLAYPILKKYGFVGNLLIQYNHVDAKNSLSSDQIRTMLNDGWEIGSAGYYGNGMYDSGSMGQEIGQSKGRLESLFGVDVTVFAYPDGYTDPEGKMIQRVVQYGYYAALGGNLRSTNVSLDNLYLIPRYLIRKGTTYNQFLEIIPWKEGTISQETMEWTLPTPTLEPEIVEQTRVAAETLMWMDDEPEADLTEGQP